MTGTTTNRAAPAGQIGLEDRGYEFEKNMFINANNETIKVNINITIEPINETTIIFFLFSKFTFKKSNKIKTKVIIVVK